MDSSSPAVKSQLPLAAGNRTHPRLEWSRHPDHQNWYLCKTRSYSLRREKHPTKGTYGWNMKYRLKDGTRYFRGPFPSLKAGQMFAQDRDRRGDVA